MSEGRRHAAADAAPEGIGGPMLFVTMGGDNFVAIRASRYSLTRHEDARGRSFGAMTIAISTGQAVYFEQDAQGLRDLAAACLNCADKLDGGKGRQ